MYELHLYLIIFLLALIACALIAFIRFIDNLKSINREVKK
jgi:hypothetical protein